MYISTSFSVSTLNDVNRRRVYVCGEWCWCWLLSSLLLVHHGTHHSVCVVMCTTYLQNGSTRIHAYWKCICLCMRVCVFRMILVTLANKCKQKDEEEVRLCLVLCVFFSECVCVCVENNFKCAPFLLLFLHCFLDETVAATTTTTCHEEKYKPRVFFWT